MRCDNQEIEMAQNKKLTRHECREKTFMLLFAREFDKETPAPEFYDIQTENSEEDTNETVRQNFLSVCEAVSDLDAEIEAVSVKWKVSRMSIASRSMLRLAVWEMAAGGVPAKVAINEAVEIVKIYDDESAPAFVNGILNTIARNRQLIGKAAE